MNILLEINDRDFILIGLIASTLVLLSIIIFFIITKNKITKETNKETNKNIELTEEQKKAKEELERVFNQMQNDLETKNEQTNIETFEQQQEENAIISYQELIEQAQKKEKSKETHTKEETKQLELKLEEPKKFKNSDIISPIFGIQSNPEPIKKSKNELQNNVAAHHTYKEIKKDYEDKDNQEFLNSLKEFRKNL